MARACSFVLESRRPLAGSATAAVSAIAVAKLAGASRETLLSLSPKSATAPVAMGIAEKLGGLPSLTAWGSTRWRTSLLVPAIVRLFVR